VSPQATEERLNGVTLDFEQRQRANRLFELVHDDPMMAAFELIYLRDKLAELEKARG
jgi:hypothetical protein